MKSVIWEDVKPVVPRHAPAQPHPFVVAGREVALNYTFALSANLAASNRVRIMVPLAKVTSGTGRQPLMAKVPWSLRMGFRFVCRIWFVWQSHLKQDTVRISSKGPNIIPQNCWNSFDLINVCLLAVSLLTYTSVSAATANPSANSTTNATNATSSNVTRAANTTNATANSSAAANASGVTTVALTRTPCAEANSYAICDLPATAIIALTAQTAAFAFVPANATVMAWNAPVTFTVVNGSGAAAPGWGTAVDYPIHGSPSPRVFVNLPKENNKVRYHSVTWET